MLTLSPQDWSHVLQTLATTDLSKNIADVSVALTGTAVAFLIFLATTGVITYRRRSALKGPIFTLIVLLTVSTTLALAAGSIALNITSATGGPVRWGTDYQLWVCGSQLDLRDPRGLINDRVGSPTLYEKNDGRIYYEGGVPSQLPDDASLGKFMQMAGGEISDRSLVIPLNDTNSFVGTPASPEQLESYIVTNHDGMAAVAGNGQTCGQERAEVQAFAYSFSPATNTYSQTKLTHPAAYELSHADTSPPGDCLIVEFAPPKERTDHLCASYGVRDYDRCTEFGIPATEVTRCDIREVR